MFHALYARNEESVDADIHSPFPPVSPLQEVNEREEKERVDVER